MSFVQDDFRSYIFGGTTECPGLLSSSNFLSKPKINLEGDSTSDSDRKVWLFFSASRQRALLDVLTQ